MFEKIGAVINLFRKGSEVSNVEAWKTGGISIGVLAAFFGALLSFGDAFGLHLAVTPEQINGIATGVIALVGVVLPLVTSKRAGILPARAEPAPIEDHSVISSVPETPAFVATEPVQPDPHTAACVGEQFVDEQHPLAGLDTTYRG